MRQETRAIRTAAVLVLSLCVVAAAVVLVGCSDARVSAVEEALERFNNSEEDFVGGLVAPDISKQLKSVKKGKQETFKLTVQAPDLEKFSPKEGELAFRTAMPTVDSVAVSEDAIAAGTAKDPARDYLRNLSADVRRALLDYVREQRDKIPSKDYQLTVTLAKAKDGYQLTFDNENESLELRNAVNQSADRVVSDLVVQTPQWQTFLLLSNPERAFTAATGNETASGGFAKTVVIREVVPTKVGYQVTFAYPDPVAAHQAAADDFLAGYGKGSKPLFTAASPSTFAGSSLEAAFERISSKLEKNQTLTAELRAGVPDSSSPPLTPKIPVDLADEFAMASGVPGFEPVAPAQSSLPDLQVLADEMGQKCATEINKRVVKKQKLPKSKVLSGKSRGSAITLKSKKGAGSCHVTFTKAKGGKKVLTAMVRNGKTLTVRLPSGKYNMRWGTGTTWYGNKYSFGPGGSYQKLKNSFTIRGNARYSITLYTVRGGNAPISSDSYSY
jgi:hypothetical protein